jgi:hypothetical protein
MSKKHLQENFYKRLKHLGGVKSSNNPSANLSMSTLIDYSRANDGVALGIVKESHHYYIKTSSSKGEKLGAEDFAYIGGVENKFKYHYPSLSEAEKIRNMYLNALNESHSKKFKKIALTEGENIDKAQTNGDALNADNAQSEADKGKNKEPLKDTAKEKGIAAVPSEKEIVVDKKQVNPKTVDDTKTGGKVTITNKQATAKVVKENFGQEENPFPPSEDGAAAAPATPDAESTLAEPIAADATASPVGDEAGNEDAELDAAASALDSLGAGDGAADASADAAGAPAPDTDGGFPDADQSLDGDAGIKDIEKLTGKVTQKIRSANLTPEMTKGFLKSYITAFEDKLPELDHEDRKELATAILKDKNDSDMGIGDQTASPEDAEEKEIEETINAHLAEMGITESDVNIEGSAESSDHKPFKDYVKARGYNAERVDEISLMEMVSLVNGYTNECGEVNPDVQGLAEFVTTEVAEKVAESGNSLFENLMKPFGEKIKKNKKAYATEAVIPSINENFGEEDDADADEEGDAKTAIFGAEKDGDADDATAISVGTAEEPQAASAEPASAMSIAPAGETIGAGAIGADASKTVTLDLNNNTISVTMNESTAKKLEKIVQKKIQEQLSGKKSPLTESKKSALSAFIDEEVNKAIAIRRKKIEERLSK